MSPQTPLISWMEMGFPRVSGDEPCGFDASRGGFSFSPRERG